MVSSTFGGPSPYDLSQMIADKIEHYVHANVNCDSLDLSLKLDNQYHSELLLNQHLEIFIDWNKNKESLTGKVLIPLRFKTPDHVIPGHVSVCIRKFDRVGVTRRLMARNEIISDGDVEMEMREVTSIKRSTFKRHYDLIGKRLKRAIGEGRIITNDMVESQPVIKKGDRVDVMLVNKNLTMILTGIAKEDGWIGDRIRIRKNNDRNELKARVKSAGVVEIY